MMKAHIALYSAAAAIAVVGVVVFGLPASGWWLLALLAACPLMMMFMMRGMHGDHGKAGHEDVGASPQGAVDRGGAAGRVSDQGSRKLSDQR